MLPIVKETENPEASPSKLTGSATAQRRFVTRGRKNPLWLGLSRRLEEATKAANMNLLAVAKLSGYAPSTVWAVARGGSEPTIETAERIATAVGVSACWLAFGDEGPEPFVQKRAREGRQSANAMSEAGTTAFEAAYAGVGARLRIRRETLGLSLRGLAEAAGISYQQIANIEAATHIPKVDSIHRLSVALDVAPCWLAYGVGRTPGS